eukprot:gene21570-26422_t
MGKLVVSLDGVVIKEVQITKDKTTLGRRPYNDIVIDNGYISGFHAELLRQADGNYDLVDLKTSNGTYLNGQRIDRAPVKGGDKVRSRQRAASWPNRTL